VSYKPDAAQTAVLAHFTWTLNEVVW